MSGESDWEKYKEFIRNSTFDGQRIPTDRLEEHFKTVEASKCTLCGNDKDGIGVYVPNKLIQGKIRNIAYGICTTCRNQNDFVDRIEKVMEYQGWI